MSESVRLKARGKFILIKNLQMHVKRAFFIFFYFGGGGVVCFCFVVVVVVVVVVVIKQNIRNAFRYYFENSLQLDHILPLHCGKTTFLSKSGHCRRYVCFCNSNNAFTLCNAIVTVFFIQ